MIHWHCPTCKGPIRRSIALSSSLSLFLYISLLACSAFLCLSRIHPLLSLSLLLFGFLYFSPLSIHLVLTDPFQCVCKRLFPLSIPKPITSGTLTTIPVWFTNGTAHWSKTVGLQGGGSFHHFPNPTARFKFSPVLNLMWLFHAMRLLTWRSFP